jgi:glycosyltransferase involved in cell wall biosynthesis
VDKIFWVCVLYNTNPADSLTLISLSKIFKENVNCKHNILIYDNSLLSTKGGNFFSSNVTVSFQHNSKNPGIAVAYNCALKEATNLKKKWLVLLDQDSVLSSDFLIQLRNSFDAVQNDDSIVAIIPKVYHKQTLVSPSRLFCGVLNLSFKDPGYQKLYRNISAINSGSAISVDFLNGLSGFNEEFPLDILDHWLFYEIFLFKKGVFLNSATIQHSLSLSEGPISCQRYKSVLSGEKKLYGDIKRKKIFYSLVLLIRTLKQLMKGQLKLAKMTFQFLVKCYAD